MLQPPQCDPLPTEITILKSVFTCERERGGEEGQKQQDSHGARLECGISGLDLTLFILEEMYCAYFSSTFFEVHSIS